MPSRCETHLILSPRAPPRLSLLPPLSPVCRLAWFNTDKALHTDSVFLRSFNEFAQSQDAFFKAYAPAHAQLSELGSKFYPAQGIKLDDARSRL